MKASKKCTVVWVFFKKARYGEINKKSAMIATCIKSILEDQMLRSFQISFLIMMFAVGISKSANAVPCPNRSNIYTGPVFFADQKWDSLTISGPGDLQSSTILGKTVVWGPFTGRDSTFQDMEITGPLKLVDSSLVQGKFVGPVKFQGVQVKGPLVVKGPLEAAKSEMQDIVIHTQNLTLSDSKVRSLKIKANQFSDTPQRLHLSGNTTIAGIIEFESGDGIVVISGDNVRVDKTIGAKVEVLKK